MVTDFLTKTKSVTQINVSVFVLHHLTLFLFCFHILEFLLKYFNEVN